eukprot:2986548-Prorocentrum_lima.AAC.1
MWEHGGPDAALPLPPVRLLECNGDPSPDHLLDDSSLRPALHGVGVDEPAAVPAGERVPSGVVAHLQCARKLASGVEEAHEVPP